MTHDGQGRFGHAMSGTNGTLVTATHKFPLMIKTGKLVFYDGIACSVLSKDIVCGNFEKVSFCKHLCTSPSFFLAVEFLNNLVEES